jgi:hypothetical protein
MADLLDSLPQCFSLNSQLFDDRNRSSGTCYASTPRLSRTKTNPSWWKVVCLFHNINKKASACMRFLATMSMFGGPRKRPPWTHFASELEIQAFQQDQITEVSHIRNTPTLATLLPFLLQIWCPTEAARIFVQRWEPNPNSIALSLSIRSFSEYIGEYWPGEWTDPSLVLAFAFAVWLLLIR